MNEQNNQQFEKKAVEENGFLEKDMKFFTESPILCNLNSLHIYISKNNIGDKGSEYLIEWISKHSNLTELILDLGDTEIGYNVFDYDNFTNTDGGMFLNKLGKCKHLEKLSLFLYSNIITKLYIK